MPSNHFRRKLSLPVSLIASQVVLLGGCHEHFGAPHHVLHGRASSVFIKPVGHGYPDIVQRTKASDYRPLPAVQRPSITDKAPTVKPQAQIVPDLPEPPKLIRKQSILAPYGVVPAPSRPAATMPTVDIVPHEDDAGDGRATTQIRR